MSSHWKWFVLGIVITLVVLAGGAYLFVKAGGISMETTAAPLPLEKTVAGMALPWSTVAEHAVLFVFPHRGQHGVVIEGKRILLIRRMPQARAQRHAGDGLFERQRRRRGLHRNSPCLHEQVSAAGENHQRYDDTENKPFPM